MIFTSNARALAFESSMVGLLMKARRKATTSPVRPRRDGATHSTPSMTLEKNCSSEYATAKEYAVLAFSSTRICP
uniref:Secreted protein n=1 Tax=Angiostrongylus cantonensis TaxID=6313 RepID=A0A0K0DGF4_ANGCA